MQVYEKCDIDARTFPEIWESLTPAERSELRYLLVKNAGCTRQSVFNWSKGSYPVYRDKRLKVAYIVGHHLHLNVNHMTLFPNAR